MERTQQTRLGATVRRVALPTLAAVTLMGLGAVAVAKPGQGAKRGAVCERLGCSDEQRAELGVIVKELRTDAKPDREAIRSLQAELAAEWATDAPDEAKLEALTGQIATHHQAMGRLAQDALMEVHALLDAGQRATLAKLIERRGLRALMGGGRHRGGKKGGKNGGGKNKSEAAERDN